MFLKEKTKEQFGYYPEDLKPSSKKLVCVACDDCGAESIRKKLNIKNLNVQVCSPCSIKRSTKATKANIIEILEKRKQTCLREHGVAHNSQRPEIAAKMSAGIKASAPIQQAKIKATNLLRYGYTSPLNNPNVIAKIKATNLERYGAENVSNSKEIQEKRTQTFIERFGGTTPHCSPEVREKSKQTCLEKYGVEHGGMSPSAIEARKKTNLEKYGCENPLANKEIRQKIRLNNIAKYGTHSPATLPETNEKRKLTNLKKYGCENPFENEEVKNKIKETIKKIYGAENVQHVPEIIEKKRKTCLEIYGVENPNQHPLVQQKSQQTNIERYGNPFAVASKEIRERIVKTNLERYGFTTASQHKDVQAKMKNTCLSRYGSESYLSTKEARKRIIKTNIEKYGTPFPIKKYRATQKQIQDWLNSLGFEFKSDCTILDGKEIDMYDKNLNLGIEYCGLYWHNELSPSPREKHYHNDKRLKCEEKGVRLITIFEDEWLHKEHQCKNFIKALLRKNSIKLGARDCIVKEISKMQANEFINNHHIQGSNNLGLYFAGLFHNDDLIAVMSFGRHPRISSKLTLDRLCFKNDIFVTGGASRLFKFLVNKYHIKEIISWSDNRWSQGQVYKSLGFTLDTELDPDYSYVDFSNCIKRLSKQSQKKNKDTPERLTEREWCMERGLARIWDCGKKRWKWTAIKQFNSRITKSLIDVFTHVY